MFVAIFLNHFNEYDEKISRKLYIKYRHQFVDQIHIVQYEQNVKNFEVMIVIEINLGFARYRMANKQITERFEILDKLSIFFRNLIHAQRAQKRLS